MTAAKLADGVTMDEVPAEEVAAEVAAARELIDKFPYASNGVTSVVAIVHLAGHRDRLAAELEAAKEKIAVYADVDRQMCASFNRLAEERDALRSQNARLVALLGKGLYCANTDWENDARALLAEIKETP